jgi:hypothetical protein
MMVSGLVQSSKRMVYPTSWPRRQPRLRARHFASRRQPRLRQVLRDLRRLARPRLADHDQDLVVRHRLPTPTLTYCIVRRYSEYFTPSTNNTIDTGSAFQKRLKA